MFDYVAAFLYEGDAPLAERKAQALTLDRNLLRELIGGGELRDLLDPDVLAEVEAELQQLADERKARDADEIHDLLRRLGDLSRDEIAARTHARAGATSVDAALRALVASRPASRAVRIAGGERYIAAEDAARYRDGLGVALPPGLPAALLEPVARAADRDAWSRATRARTRRSPPTGPPRAGACPRPQIEPVLALLEARGQLVRGELRPGGIGIRTRAIPRSCASSGAARSRKLRAQVAPVGARDVRRVPAALARARSAAARARRAARCDRPARGRRAAVLRARAADPARADPRLSPAHARRARRRRRAGVGRRRRARHQGRPRDPAAPRARARARARAAADREPHRRSTTRSSTTCGSAGASFLVAIEQAVARARTRAIAARRSPARAVGSRVGRRSITNDTFAPLRSLRRPARAGRCAHASVRRPVVARRVARPAADADRRAPTRMATALLERWGIASRDAARADELPGGFAAVGDVLRAMEDAGTVRRGYFVESLEGAQFAWPGAIDRLREAPRGQAPAGRRARRGRSRERVGQRPALAAAPRSGRAPGAPRRRDRDPRRRRARGVARASARRLATAPLPDERSSSRSRSACRGSRRRRAGASCWSRRSTAWRPPRRRSRARCSRRARASTIAGSSSTPPPPPQVG